MSAERGVRVLAALNAVNTASRAAFGAAAGRCAEHNTVLRRAAAYHARVARHGPPPPGGPPGAA